MVTFNIEADVDQAVKALKDLEIEVDASADSAAKEIAEAAKRRAVNALLRQGSIGTGRGISSLHVQKMGENQYALMGKRYLEFVDRGTMPHRPPINNRMMVWAQRHGINPSNLADKIEREGTDPNPWMNRAFLPILKSADDRGAAVMKRQTRLQ